MLLTREKRILMRVIKQTLLLEGLNREATLYVMLPKDYDKDTKYPLIIMHDAQNLFSDQEASFGVSWGLKALFEQAPMKKVIVAGLSCANGLSRLDEYNPFLSKEPIGLGEKPRVTGGKGDIYLRTIIDKVLPGLKENYTIDFDDISIGGSSMGGLISLYASLIYPHIFKNAFCLSSAFWISDDDFIHFIESSNKKHYGKIYLDTGDKEDSTDFTYMKSNENVYKALKDKGIDVRFDVIKGGIHHESSWKKRIKEIITFIQT